MVSWISFKNGKNRKRIRFFVGFVVQPPPLKKKILNVISRQTFDVQECRNPPRIFQFPNRTKCPSKNPANPAYPANSAHRPGANRSSKDLVFWNEWKEWEKLAYRCSFRIPRRKEIDLVFLEKKNLAKLSAFGFRLSALCSEQTTRAGIKSDEAKRKKHFVMKIARKFFAILQRKKILFSCFLAFFLFFFLLLLFFPPSLS